jgi:hypothetical protein
VPIAVLRDLGLDVEWNAEKRTVTVRGWRICKTD